MRKTPFSVDKESKQKYIQNS